MNEILNDLDGFEEIGDDEPSLIEFDTAVSIFGLDMLSNILKERETDKLNVAFAGELPLRVFNDPLTNSFSSYNKICRKF